MSGVASATHGNRRWQSLCLYGEFGSPAGLAKAGDVMPLVELAARNAFWDFKKPTLQMFLRDAEIEHNTAEALHDLLMKLIAHHLPDADDAETLRILRMRVKKADEMTAFLSTPDAAALIDTHDQECIKTQQEAENKKCQTR